MNVGSLFSGIGGLDLGLERAGMNVVWQAENDPYASKVLAKHWPDVPNLGDVTEVDWDAVERVDLVCGGFPCQPISHAGTKLGEQDERWMWPEFVRCINILRPDWIIVENVPSLRVRGLRTVRNDLDALGYVSRPIELSACQMGAPHTRRRLFTLAHTARLRCPQGLGRSTATLPAGNEERRETRRSSWWADQPQLGRVAYGVPRGLDRRRVIGNAVVPQVAELIGRAILEADAA